MNELSLSILGLICTIMWGISLAAMSIREDRKLFYKFLFVPPIGVLFLAKCIYHATFTEEID